MSPAKPKGGAKKKVQDGRKSVCRNRKARFRYSIEETLEAGLVLTGSEVKSLRDGRAHLNDAYASVQRGQAYLMKAHIEPYTFAHHENHEPTRPRKLLMHSRELARLGGKVAEKGFTLVPLELYFKDGRAKVEIALARGKKLYDKRQTIAKREIDRDLARISKRGGRR